MADNLVSKELNILFFQAQTVVFFLFVPLFKLDNKVDRLGILYALDTKQRLDVDDTDTAQLLCTIFLAGNPDPLSGIYQVI